MLDEERGQVKWFHLVSTDPLSLLGDARFCGGLVPSLLQTFWCHIEGHVWAEQDVAASHENLLSIGRTDS